MTSATNRNYSNGAMQSRLPAILQMTVRGFKSLANKSSIDIRPLTVLAGANSSGKSSMMQPMLLLKQTLEVAYDPGVILLNGPNTRFSSSKEFLTSLQPNNQDRFLVELRLDTGAGLSTEFQPKSVPNDGLEIRQQSHFARNGDSLTLNGMMSKDEVRSVVSHNFVSSPDVPNLDELDDLYVRSQRCFLSAEGIRVTEKGPNLVVPLARINSDVPAALQSILHVPGLRGTRDRVYPSTGSGPQFPGTFDVYIASIIYAWQQLQPEKIVKLNQHLSDLGLANKIQAVKLNDTQLEIYISRIVAQNATASDEDMVNIADVGIGVSQVLPMLVALLTASSGQMVYTEQPEIHLHPRAQTALAQIIVDAANRGVRVVVETHSSLLLLAIQTLVAEGELATDKAILHWFERDEDGVTQISSSGLDEAGAYGEWPVDFDDVSLKIQSRYLDAAESHYLAQ